MLAYETYIFIVTKIPNLLSDHTNINTFNKLVSQQQQQQQQKRKHKQKEKQNINQKLKQKKKKKKKKKKKNNNNNNNDRKINKSLNIDKIRKHPRKSLAEQRVLHLQGKFQCLRQVHTMMIINRNPFEGLE